MAELDVRRADRRGREDDGCVEIAVRLGQQIGDLCFTVLLKHDRVAAFDGEKIDVAMRRGTGGDPAARQKRKPPHVAIANLAEKGDAFGGQRRRIGEFGGVDSGGAEFVQLNPVNAAGIARRHKRRTGARMG